MTVIIDAIYGPDGQRMPRGDFRGFGRVTGYAWFVKPGADAQLLAKMAKGL